MPLDRMVLLRTEGRRTLLGPIGAPTLLLETTGRKSGLKRISPLLFARDDDGKRVIVVGSNFGQQHHPAWTGNLIADPSAVVKAGGRAVPVRATLLEGAAADAGYQKMVDVTRVYDVYRGRTDRQIRVFRLTPEGKLHVAGLPMPDFALRALARQLGGPSGPFGHLVARMLNKGNAAAITAAVDALQLAGGETVADIGFGGGLGLDLLLTAVPSGVVHGVEPSTSMLTRARRGHADQLGARLVLHEAPMAALPFEDGSVDGWISLNTIYFIEDLEPAFRELGRVLGPDGRGVLGIADPEWMAKMPFTKHGFILRPVADVIALLEAAGLDVEQRQVEREGPAYFLLLSGHVPTSDWRHHAAAANRRRAALHSPGDQGDPGGRDGHVAWAPRRRRASRRWMPGITSAMRRAQSKGKLPSSIGSTSISASTVTTAPAVLRSRSPRPTASSAPVA